ncbi:F-box domain-containing protein [Mycena venus]|uniref:F-box domain-containing protein n=1 Tax=Mycena venus TaxID=2733690 RepID=A0A8H7CVI4_9AGAR|nr:F-box domain-containing protein [Mycena venus]
MSVICEDCGHLNWCHARFPAGTPSAQRAELADIQHQLEVLKTRERDLEAALASVVYPVLTLPPEITSRIFLKCLPFHGRVQPSATKAPLVLAQVCRHWRDVALATARLWSSIDLKFEVGRRNIPDNGTMPLLRTWLSRAKRSPISLTLRLPYDQPISKEVLSVIPSYAGQLRRLELKASDSDCEALRATCSDFPVLRDLAMACYGSGPDPFSIFRNASALREIRLPYMSFANGVFFQSYVSLHTLQLQEMSVAALVDMLTDFPQLLHLDTGISDYTPFDKAGVVPVTANLESLIIKSREDAPDPPVLDYLTLPKLRRLELHHPPQFQALSSFRIRSACVLEHLALQISTHPECWELIRILSDFSGIISLDLDTYTYLDSFIYGLRDTTLLPHLRSLRLNSWRDGINYTRLVRCLRVRNRDRKVLKSFKLGFDNPRVSELAGLPTDDLILAELESLVADGLKVQICSSEGWWPSETDRTIDHAERFP